MNYRDEFKVSFVKNPFYYIDEKKGTVKCYLTCDIKVPNALAGNQVMNNTRISATGYAKCGENDEFDLRIGKKISLARAEEKIYLKAKNLINEAKNDALVFVKAADKFEKKCYRVCAHNEDYIDQYCLATHPKYKQKPSVNEFLSNKAKSQPRDEQGRFTACTRNDKRVCENKEQKKGIKILINRI